jgi:hypothetical protein
MFCRIYVLCYSGTLPELCDNEELLLSLKYGVRRINWDIMCQAFTLFRVSVVRLI